MRKPRIQFEGALYHVIVRGNQRQRVFFGPADHHRYLQLLGKKSQEHSIKIYAYCLMPNHVHLLVEQSADRPLSKFMQGLQTAYTKFFNIKHKKSGHLFQGRYKAFLVERENYLLELVRYIHLNPFRGKLEEKVGDYPWTSHGQYVGKEKRPRARVAKSEILAMLARTMGTAAYLNFVRDGIGQGHRHDFYEAGSWQVLGSDGYEARTLARVWEKPERPLRLKMRFVEIWTRLKGREWLGREPIGHTKSRLMSEAAWIAVNTAGESQTTIARYFGIGQSGISRSLKRLEKIWEREPGKRKLLLAWAKGLKKS